MGIVFKIKGAEFTNALDFLTYPQGAGLQNLYFMEDSLAASLKDKSGNENNLAVTGSLEVSNHMAHFTKQSGVSSQMLTLPNVPTYENGFFAIAVFSASGDRTILSSIINSGSYSGFELTTSMFLCGVGDNGQMCPIYKHASEGNELPESGKLRIVAVSVKGSHLTTYRYNDNGLILYRDVEMTPAASLSTVAEFKPNTNSLKIGGSSMNFSQFNPMDLGMVALYDAIPSTEEIRDMCKYLKKYYTDYGFEFDELM